MYFFEFWRDIWNGRWLVAGIVGAVAAEAEDRAVPGRWEGNLLLGSHNCQIATLVERQTRYDMLVRVAGKDTETVVNALIKQAH